jgi:lysophospholipase L1-like esterase
MIPTRFGVLFFLLAGAACASPPAADDFGEHVASTHGSDASPGDAGPRAVADASSHEEAAPPSDAAPSAWYLALGDSIAFGQNPTIADEMELALFIGYPVAVAAAKGYGLANAGCSGEATSGFISATGADNGCREDKARGRLHTIYTSTQLEFATSFLKAHPETALVTLDIGANDLILVKKACDGGVLCEIAGLPKVSSAVGANARTIFKGIRDTGYSGPIVLVTTYIPDYNDSTAALAMSLVNNATTSEVQKADIHGRVADGYGAMKNAASASKGDACAAGLLIPLPEGGCDIHPTPAGRKVLEQAVLDALK